MLHRGRRCLLVSVLLQNQRSKPMVNVIGWWGDVRLRSRLLLEGRRVRGDLSARLCLRDREDCHARYFRRRRRNQSLFLS